VRTRSPDHPGASDPVRRRLIAIGLGSLPIYGLIAILSAAFRYGEGYRERPILAVLALLALAWVGYACALAAVLGRWDSPAAEPVRVESAAGRRLSIVLAFALAFRLILLVSRPIQEIDYYRYLWDGRVVLSGLNPFEYAPAEIDRLGPESAPDSALGRLWRLAGTSAPLRTIFERVHHRAVPTIYPPASQAVFALAALVTQASAPVGVHVLVLKCLLIAFDVGTLLVLARLLRRIGLSEDWSLAYGWCPLVLKEFANTAHLDAIAVFLTVLAAYHFVATPDRPSGRRPLREPVLGAVALGLAVLAKGYPLVLLPMIAGFLAARWRRRAMIPALVFASIILAGYVPFLAGSAPIDGGPSHSPWTGLGTFLARWQKNDFLFMLAHENLRPPTPGVPDRWFVVVPGDWRRMIDRMVAAPLARLLDIPDAEPAFLLTQGVMGTIFATIALAWAVRVFRTPEPCVLLRGTALVLAWGWLLSSTPHPWYLTWSLPFLVFARRRSWFLLPGLAPIYYLRFHLEYQAAPGGLSAINDAFHTFDYGVVWFEFGPFLAALAVETWRGWNRSRRAGRGPAQLPSDGR
jgi:hypothetical protein